MPILHLSIKSQEIHERLDSLRLKRIEIEESLIYHIYINKEQVYENEKKLCSPPYTDNVHSDFRTKIGEYSVINSHIIDNIVQIYAIEKKIIKDEIMFDKQNEKFKVGFNKQKEEIKSRFNEYKKEKKIESNKYEEDIKSRFHKQEEEKKSRFNKQKE
jgi:hypothetical protein